MFCSLSLAIQLAPGCLAAGQPELNFKIYSPSADTGSAPSESAPAKDAGTEAGSSTSEKSPVDSLWSSDPAQQSPAGDSASNPAPSPATTDNATAPATDTSTSGAATPATDSASPDSTGETKPEEAGAKKTLLQGYIRVVPSGTKIPIIMDTAIDTDTSQEGDEFAARTGEDLNIDGMTVVPAGSVIKGRIAQLNGPKNLGRAGSVALKFDTVTTPDNRQIPLVANLVARGGVVHARRGVKDIALDTGTFVLPTVIGIGIGALAGGTSNSKGGTAGTSSHLGRGGGALIGAGVGAGVGIIILAVKKGKKIDMRPGDELKIELAEDLRMPM